MIDPMTACKTGLAAVSGVVAAECANLFFGLPVTWIYAGLIGAGIGLARRSSHEDWDRFIPKAGTVKEYFRAGFNILGLAVTFAGNALVSAWAVHILGYVDFYLTKQAATHAPIACTGLLAYGSWTWFSKAIDWADTLMKRKAGGG